MRFNRRSAKPPDPWDPRDPRELTPPVRMPQSWPTAASMGLGARFPGGYHGPAYLPTPATRVRLIDPFGRVVWEGTILGADLYLTTDSDPTKPRESAGNTPP